MKRIPENPEKLPDELLRLAEQQPVGEPERIGSILPTVLKSHGMVIPTVYNGIQYRSRLEARWAVFFDTLNLQFDYEPEGFDFGGLRYLPDFWFPELGFYVEIKPEPANDLEIRKAESLAEATGKPVYLFQSPFVSVPEDGEYLQSLKWIPWADICDPMHWDHGYYWCECWRCGKLGIQFEGRSARICVDTHGEIGGRWENAHSPRLMMAYRTARSARFWK